MFCIVFSMGSNVISKPLEWTLEKKLKLWTQHEIPFLLKAQQRLGNSEAGIEVVKHGT
jgi:hypothetical protein